MILNETYTLENGLSIPKLGLGTWFIDDDQAADAVRTAVKLGYRLIDTAQAYGNERGVGVGVRTCGVPREELFVASKVAAELKTYDEAKKSIDETLEKMGLDYLDQMIIHSPQPWNQFRVEKRYFKEKERTQQRPLLFLQKHAETNLHTEPFFKKPLISSLPRAQTSSKS